MSDTQKDMFYENVKQLFLTDKEKKFRTILLTQIKERGFDDLYENLLQEWNEERIAWLLTMDRKEGDVMTDSEEREYVLITTDENKNIQVYLPDYLDIHI